MIVDSSALVAIVKGEADAEVLLASLVTAPRLAISAATLVEASVVIDGTRDPVRIARIDELLASLELDVAPLTAAQATIARQAYRDYGKGSGHPARLDLDDFFSYALAKDCGEPLLYVGGGFARTDVASASG
ncbi:type II toxin-antitoxin system VapC family toxin [Microbacterium aurum]